jgi:hypothetical protein
MIITVYFFLFSGEVYTYLILLTGFASSECKNDCQQIYVCCMLFL